MKNKVTFYVVAEKYARLKSKLALLGLTFTKWIEQKMDEELEDK
jgi:hypothetical protein